MHCHANARLTPRGRASVFLLVEAGMTVTAAGVLGTQDVLARSFRAKRPRNSKTIFAAASAVSSA